jgi:DeoR family transcriptional regulator, suf operon transcriptional repressor
MHTTREKILQTLLENPHSTINELAKAVSINSISVRHHLSSLLIDGLVQSDEERHGVGRPRLVFSLSQKGIERFPTRYFELTSRLLDQMKETLPTTVINRFFTDMAENLVKDYQQQTAGFSIEQKLNYIKDMLQKQGFSVGWEKKEAHYYIYENGCPYFHISQAHPEICSVDQTLISRVMNIPVEKISCVLSGDSSCIYSISKETLEGASL